MKRTPPTHSHVPAQGGDIEGQPERLSASADDLLRQRLGETDEPITSQFARAATGLLGEQTHYSEGFAVLLTLGQGIGVAVRASQQDKHRVVFGEDTTVWTEGNVLPYWAQLVMATADEWAEGETLDIAVSASITSSCLDAYVGALTAASFRAVCAHKNAQNNRKSSGAGSSGTESSVLKKLAAITEEITDLPFSPAYQIAALNETPYDLELIDTATLEHMPVQVEGGENLSWAMFDLGFGLIQDPAFHRKAKAQTQKAIAHLKDHGFQNITSFRELEHRDLQIALESLPEDLQPIARHLVTENRRVQKLVRAARQEDWQFFGALLLMSHASLRSIWKSTRPELDFIVDQADSLSMEGVYGACQTGRGGCVLIAGQPYTLPGAVREIKSSYEASFDSDLNVNLL